MNRMNCTYHTIHRHVVLFDLNKLLLFPNTKLLGHLIKSNKITYP